MIRFTVPAVPIAQPRPRAVAFQGKARVFGAKKSHAVHDFKASVRMAFAAEYKGPPLQGPLFVQLVFVMPRPGRLIWKTRPMPREPHVTKPDIDNVGKAAVDALLGVAFRDDSQINRLTIEKWIASGDEQPHTAILIQEDRLQ